MLVRSVVAQSPDEKSVTPVSEDRSAKPPAANEKKSDNKARDLTDGLLDLLTEPKPAGSPAGKPSTSPPKTGETPNATLPLNPPVAAPEKGSPRMDGEDVGEHPLVRLREDMAAAAGLLRTEQARGKAQDLQMEIVSRLDQLIGDLENKPASSQSQASSGQSSSTNQMQTSPASANQSKPGESSQAKAGNTRPVPTPSGDADRSNERNADDPNKHRGNSKSNAGDSASGESTSQGTGKNQPNTAGRGDPSNPGGDPSVSGIGQRQTAVELSDPTALQRSAWGNLPERVREQMQSRMVERFLPGYRDEIEAYYRALAK